MTKQIKEFWFSAYLKKRYGHERVARWMYYGAFYFRKSLQLMSLVLCPLLAVGCIYWGHCVEVDYRRDVLLAVGVGLMVYFGTVQCSSFVRRIRIKQRLRQHYRFFKKRTIETLLSAAEVKFFYHDELCQKLMEPKEFRLFFATSQDGNDKLYEVMNNLADNPAALHDLRVEIDLFFNRVTSLWSSADINVSAIDRFFQYAEHYKRLQSSNLTSHDTKYLVESLYQCFSDCSFISCGPCEFSHVIDEI
jgi:hypothetical protein